MKRITANRAVWLFAAGLSSFFAMYFLMGHENTVEVSSGLLLGSYVVLTVSWMFAALYAIMNGARSDSDVLAIGICMASLFGSARQIWGMFYRGLERPPEMLEHWTNPFMVYAIFWGVVIMILAPGADKDEIPIRNKIHLFIAALIGVLVAGIAIGWSLTKNGVL